MHIGETERLYIRQLNANDAEFILQLLNQPDWLKYIGDKQVYSLEAAEEYIKNGPVSMYRRFGYGLYQVSLKSDNQPIGICGLLKRDYLDRPDLGFALLSEYCHQGYALEAAMAVNDYVFETFAITELAAITINDNKPSISLLNKLGFKFKRIVRNQPDSEALNLYTYTRPEC